MDDRREICEQHLLEAGLRDFFELFVCADEAGKTKPAPDPYLLAVRKMRCLLGSLSYWSDGGCPGRPKGIPHSGRRQ